VLSAADQLQRVESALIASRGRPVGEPIILVDDDGNWDLSGYMELGLEYPSGHRLHVTLTVDVRYGYPAWSLYAFHFQDVEGHTVIRYDNWPHYPELQTFPDHKHVGVEEVVEAHARPSVRAIIREVQQHVAPG
jgi:hypothetical protein